MTSTFSRQPTSYGRDPYTCENQDQRATASKDTVETNGRMDTSDRNVLPANEVGKNPIPTLSLSSFERLGIAF